MRTYRQNPFFSTDSHRWPREAAWEDEVIGVNPTSGLVYGFGSTYNSGGSRYFIARYAVGVASQDGKFLAFTSDALKTLALGTKMPFWSGCIRSAVGIEGTWDYQTLAWPPAPMIFRSHSGGSFRAVAFFASFRAAFSSSGLVPIPNEKSVPPIV